MNCVMLEIFCIRKFMTQRLIAYFTWTLPLVMILCPVQVYGVDSFCIADKIPLGGLGRVSCHFNEDLSKVPQKDMTVYIYRVSDSEPEIVVLYSWINGQPRIFTEPGYNCTSNLTDHLEISVCNATREHAGDYKCVVAPSAGLNQKTCTLIIEEEKSIDSNSDIPSSYIEDQGIESFCTASSVSVGEKGFITFRFTEDLSIPPPKDLNVFLHKESATEPTLVLLYAWVNGSPRIDVTPGYICNGNLTDQLEIAVYNATIHHTGLYRSVIYHSKHKSNSCMFHVKEEISLDVTQNYTYTVAIVLGCLVLLVAIVIIIIMEFRLRPHKWKNSLRTTESPSKSAEYFIAERESLQGNNGLDL